MNWPVTLTTERLILRPWRADDADALFAYASDPDIGPAAGWPPHKSVDESREVLKNVLMVPETYALTLRDSTTQDEPIGCVGLKIGEDSDLAIGDDQAELGYWLAKPFWGQGLMPEAVRETMRHGFCDLGLTAIWAGHYQSNDKSRRVQEKVGLRHQRTIANRPLKLIGGHTNEEVNWLTCDQWLALQDPRATTCRTPAFVRAARPGQTVEPSTRPVSWASPSVVGARPVASPRTSRAPGASLKLSRAHGRRKRGLRRAHRLERARQPCHPHHRARRPQAQQRNRADRPLRQADGPPMHRHQ